MADAAKLALEAPDAAPFETRDTHGTIKGTVDAAGEAMRAGAGILVGPLTAGDTSAVAALARPRNVPVLAFTSDRTAAGPGVWAMGITPAQQVRALVRAVRLDNKVRTGAVLPSNPFGNALAQGLLEAAGDFGLPMPQIVRYQPSAAGLDDAIKRMSGASGEPPLDSAAPPAIDALLIGTTVDATVQAIPVLQRYGLGPERVRILGTALWARDATRLSGIAGAWFPGPDPQIRSRFEQAYLTRYGKPPRDLASIAFDAAGAARAVTSPSGVDVSGLLRPEGFAGADGVFVLLPDGRVRRGLAVFEIGPSGAQVRIPAPQSLAGPGS